ncbi:hypothetical protein [Flavobacterium sp. RSSB_23]
MKHKTELKIGIDKHYKEATEPLTATTTDLGNWLSGKMVLYLAV